MQFDLSRFLVAMLAAFLDCQEDGATESTPAQMVKSQRVAVRIVARRELRRQAKKQGANRRDRKKFVQAHLEGALESLHLQVGAQPSMFAL